MTLKTPSNNPKCNSLTPNTKPLPSLISNEAGLATIEALPILVIFLVLVSYGLGLFGVIHSGILYSIAARTYAFETFRNRANLTYHREQGPSAYHNQQMEIRYHGIQENNSGDNYRSPIRPLNFGGLDVFKPENKNLTNKQVHNVGIFNIAPNSGNPLGVSPVWLMIGYGMCLNASCGDPN